MVGKKNKDILFEIYKDSRTVFRINDISILLGDIDDLLYKKLNYYVNTGKLLNPRRGIYAKENYNAEELACLLYTPTYISLGYVLQRNSVIFQYDSAITNISYLSREIVVGKQKIQYRQIKGEILLNTAGIINRDNINIATPERAFLDTLYLTKYFYFDNINPHCISRRINIHKFSRMIFLKKQFCVLRIFCF
ncbi:MAG: hypothetical protein LBP63_03730 [Prevotellaceae bacterium]|jgi:hypothetical protein|nr:hypothetical protein [Prevotellaceae bacterium]